MSPTEPGHRSVAEPFNGSRGDVAPGLLMLEGVYV